MSTLTVYASESAKVGRWAADGTNGESWGTIRASAGTNVDRTTAETEFTRFYACTDSGWLGLERSIFVFDTSSITTGNIVTDGIFSLNGTVVKYDQLPWGTAHNVFLATPANPAAIAAGDYGNIGTTALATAISFASWSTAGFNSWTLNATGISNVNRSGNTCLGVRESNFDAPNNAPTFSGGKVSAVMGNHSATSGTTSDPKLVVTYVTPTAPTVTGSAATNVAATHMTGNGNVTADGGAPPITRRGFCYKVGNSGDPTTADSVAYDDGSFSTGAYTKEITGLAKLTQYRVRAYAVNSVGTAYGTTTQEQTGAGIQANFGTLFIL